MKQICMNRPGLLLVLLILSGIGCEQLNIGPNKLPEFDWLVMGYEGELTGGEEWLTSDTLSLYRNDVYIENGAYIRSNKQNFDKLLDWKVKNDSKKGRYLSTKIKLDKTEPNFELYRGQVSFRITDEARNAKSIASLMGWPNWYTAPGQELVQAFSIRVPANQRLDFPSSSSRNGLDDPTALQVWQNRTRFNQRNTQGNIPLSIYLRGNQWMLVNGYDESPFFPGAKFNGDSLGEAIPGEWLDLVIRMSPDDKDGLVEVYTRKHFEESYSLVYEFKNQPFFGQVDPRWYPDEIDNKQVLGLPSYGIYPSTRFLHNRIQKWTEKGINSVEVHHSAIRLLQYPRGEAPMKDILRVAERGF